jgi:hypothetical protein
MFEGGLPSLGFRESVEQAGIGVQTARDYFRRQIWIECNFDVPQMRESLFSEFGEAARPPMFDDCSSLGEIAAQLQDIGNPSILSEFVAQRLKELGVAPSRNPQFDEASCDGFELWDHHFTQFGNSAMSNRIKSVRNIFHGLIDEGLPRLDLRLLDHGVCSGLLLLLAATYYYRLFAFAQKSSTPLAMRFLRGGPVDHGFWWMGIVWATAATAIHNVQQMSDLDKIDSSWPGPLKLDEDPLAYLGILVDILQEWDRYSVRKVLDVEPIQGSEVELFSVSGVVHVRFLGIEGASRTKKVERDLNSALVDWDQLVRLS